MQVLKSFFIAFALYSQVPVFRFPWKEEDMKYTFCFFPWIGAVIGGCVCIWSRLCEIWDIGNVARTAVGTVLPLVITGGFHVDGFMDTVDAFHSYESKERKLEILKDPHIGAFAVIMLAVYGLTYMGALSEIQDGSLIKIVCLGFFLSRCLSGIGAVSFPLAKGDGMLYLFADRSHKRVVKGVLYLECGACIGLMLFLSFGPGLCVASAAFLAFFCCYRRCRKALGGITGDTAGYFVVLCEVWMAIAAAAVQIISNTFGK